MQVLEGWGGENVRTTTVFFVGSSPAYRRVTNDSSGLDAHTENVGHIGVVWARVPSVVGLRVV